MAGFISWLARVLAIVGILFISAFALDVFDPEMPWRTLAAALFMHLLPSLVLAAILLIAWQFAWIGGLLFLLTGLTPFVFLSNPAWVNLMLGGPFLLAGLLFLAAHRLRKREGRRRMDDTAKAVLARVTGRVQGVSFRAWTQQEASRLGLTGWVRNESDGSVSALLSGPADAVDAMTELLWQGPPHSRVSDVTTSVEHADDRTGKFQIIQ